jgi:benzil reductase ((S)-benzoin forming)
MTSLVWISGASSGIGAALARTVPYDDAVLVDISRRGGTPGTEHVAADLADPASWPLVEREFSGRLRGFDGARVVFVHNAGTLDPIGPVGTVDTAAYTRNVLLNSAAAQVLGHAFLRAVADLRCEQHLLMISSGAARTPYEGWSSYCAGKAAVEAWVRVAGLEQRRRSPGCRVVAVAPGTVDTGMQAKIRATGEQEFPRGDRFRELHETGGLSDAHHSARMIWSVLDRDLENGSSVDVRDLG